MAVRVTVHPEAQIEHLDAIHYYANVASKKIAEAYKNEFEAAVTALAADARRFRVVEEPEIRRCVLKRFPFVIYYRWQRLEGKVTIFAVMHGSREPGYWRHRLN